MPVVQLQSASLEGNHRRDGGSTIGITSTRSSDDDRSMGTDTMMLLTMMTTATSGMGSFTTEDDDPTVRDGGRSMASSAVSYNILDVLKSTSCNDSDSSSSTSSHDETSYGRTEDSRSTNGSTTMMTSDSITRGGMAPRRHGSQTFLPPRLSKKQPLPHNATTTTAESTTISHGSSPSSTTSSVSTPVSVESSALPSRMSASVPYSVQNEKKNDYYAQVNRAASSSGLSFAGITASLSHSSSEMLANVVHRLQESTMTMQAALSPIGRTILAPKQAVMRTALSEDKSLSTEIAIAHDDDASLLSNQRREVQDAVNNPKSTAGTAASSPTTRTRALLQEIGTNISYASTSRFDDYQTDEEGGITTDDEGDWTETEAGETTDYELSTDAEEFSESSDSDYSWDQDHLSESRGFSLLDAIGTKHSDVPKEKNVVGASLGTAVPQVGDANNALASAYFSNPDTDRGSYSCDETEYGDDDDATMASRRSFDTFHEFQDDGMTLLGNMLYQLGTCNLQGARDVWMQENEDEEILMSSAPKYPNPVYEVGRHTRKETEKKPPAPPFWQPTNLYSGSSSKPIAHKTEAAVDEKRTKGGASAAVVSSGGSVSMASYLGFNEERERHRLTGSKIAQKPSLQLPSFLGGSFGSK
jgi:hypothetical protein